MTLFECVRSFLAANGTLAAKVPGGFHPHDIPQNATFPLVVVRLVSGASEPPTLDSGASSWSRVRIELTAWGGVVKVQEQIIYLIDGMFTPFNGFLGGGSSGRFATDHTFGPRSIRDHLTREVGIQLDVTGMLNRGTLS